MHLFHWNSQSKKGPRNCVAEASHVTRKLQADHATVCGKLQDVSERCFFAGGKAEGDGSRFLFLIWSSRPLRTAQRMSGVAAVMQSVMASSKDSLKAVLTAFVTLSAILFVIASSVRPSARTFGKTTNAEAERHVSSCKV